MRPRGTAPLSSPIRPHERSPFWWLKWVPAVVFIIIILDLLYILGSVAIVPVLASFALAYLLNPFVQQGEKHGLSRPFSSVVAMLLVGAAMVAFLSFVLPDLFEKGAESGRKIMSYFTTESAKRQRAALKRYSPVLDRVAGDRIEQFLSDPAVTFTSETGENKWVAGGLTGFDGARGLEPVGRRGGGRARDRRR